MLERRSLRRHAWMDGGMVTPDLSCWKSGLRSQTTGFCLDQLATTGGVFALFAGASSSRTRVEQQSAKFHRSTT